MKDYMVNEVFYSLQGEGVRAGTPNVFVRFSGCNLQCRSDNEAGFDCDTEFTSGRRRTLDDLLVDMMTAGGPSHPRNVILTGGEPGLQVDEPLINRLRADGWFIAIETNGTVELPPLIHWVCVSPKSAEHTLRQKYASEVKYVRHVGQGIPRPTIDAPHKLISPAFETLVNPDSTVRHRPAPGAMEWCIQLVKENPEWRLSVQQHKSWAIR
jgi:organic radical activating enzyme